MKILKALIKVISIIILIPVLIIIALLFYDSYDELKFIDIEIPIEMNFKKPKNKINIEKLTRNKKEHIEVTGNGWAGYNFYMWHKPDEEGELYVKAIELTQKVKLSESRLQEKTKNIIKSKSDNFKLYEGKSLIYEGTFENYYPVRFEMWFRSKKNNEEKKLAENYYLIDGWDR